MKSSKHIALILLALAIILGSCKEKEVYYGVEDVELLPPSANKDKLKTTEQYLAVAYVNLFQKALSSERLVELTDIVESCGDKALIHEVIVSNFMNESDVILPADSVMREDIGYFVDETYKRFFVRPPTELEKTFFVNYIEANPDLTPELIYFSFAISEEYQFY